MVKSENFICIQGWMRTELNLKGNDLLVYAIIYGFSQTENQRFTGSLQYLADWCGATKQGILKNLKNLLDRNLIEKVEKYDNGIKFVEYYTTQFNGVLNSVELGIKQSLINNIDNKKEDNIELNNKTNFNFGKQQPKKENLYSKCVSMVHDYTTNKELSSSLIDYLRVRLEMKDKPLYANSWKGLLNKLDREFDASERLKVVRQSIERGYASFFPVNTYNSNSIRSESGTRHVPRMTEDDYKKEAVHLAELEAQGMRVRF